MSQALFGQLMFGGFFALFAVIVLRVLRRGARGARGGAHDRGRSDDHALSSRADACDGWSFFGGACGGGGDSGGDSGGGD